MTKKYFGSLDYQKKKKDFQKDLRDLLKIQKMNIEKPKKYKKDISENENLI